MLSFGVTIDSVTNKYQLALQVVNLQNTLIAQKRYVINKDTTNVTCRAIYKLSDTSVVLNFSVDSSDINYYLIVNYKGDSLGSFTLPAFTVSAFDNGNYLCALDTNNSILVREFNQQGNIVYKYLYKPDTINNICNEIKPLPYPGKFVLTGSSNNNLLIIRQDTSNNILTVNNSLKTPENTSLYPNPNNGSFTISLLNINNICNIEIYNVLGEKIFSKSTIENSLLTINLYGQPQGIYFYRVLKETGELSGSGKLVIEK